MARNKNKNKRPPNPPKVKETIESSDDEEISEDEAFNSEDERQYGDFFSKKEDDDSASDSSFDDDDDDDDDDDGEEDDGGEYMLSLLENIDKANKDENSSLAVGNSIHLPESEHNVSSSSHTSKDDNLTIQSLLSGITSTKGFTPLQKRMHSLHKAESTSSTTPTSAPLSRPASNRQRQKLHHVTQSTELTRYSTTVATNRRAPTLDFRSTPHPTPSTRDLIGKFSPTTPFEREMAALLESKGQSSNDNDILAAENAELLGSGDDKLTLEELQKRHGAMAKMRALMFYEERKRHLAKKIKSKAYRRIQRKKRDRESSLETDALRMTTGDDDDDETTTAMREKEELERMKERMTLAHRNTSKWAKRQLRRGKHMDVDARRALSAQVKKGEDLRRKVEGESSGSEDENDMLNEMKGLFGEEREEEEAKGVFKMGFMKRAMERQKEKAKEEAKALLLELEAQEEEEMEGKGEEEQQDDDGGKTKRKKPKIAKRDVLPAGEMMASQLKHGNSSSLSVSGGIAIDLGDDDDDVAAGESCHDGDNQKAVVGAERDEEKEDGCESQSKETRTKDKKIMTNDGSSKENKTKATNDKDTTSTNDDDNNDDDDDNLANFNSWMKDTNKKKNQEDKKQAKRKRKREAREAAKTKNKSNASTTTHSEHTSEITLSKQHDDRETLSSSPATTATTNKSSSKEPTTSNEMNPWMTAPSRKRSKKQQGTANDVVDITAAASQINKDDDDGDDDNNTSSKNNNNHDKNNNNNTPQSSSSSSTPSSKPTIQLTQEELVSRAFATPETEALEEFAEEKKEIEEGSSSDKSKKNKQDDASKKGWGSWAGKGIRPPPPPPKNKPNKKQKQNSQQPPPKTPTHPPNVILNPTRITSHSRYLLGNVPYPYRTKREYELAMKGGIGPEWNVTSAINEKVMPRVLRTDGKIIKPLGRRSKSKKRDEMRKSKF